MLPDLTPDLISQYASLDDVPANHIDSVLALRLDELEEDPDQPRREFREEAMVRLAEDMANHGQRVPIIVRPPVNGVYRIVHGARRYRVAKRARWPHLRAIVEKDSGRYGDLAQWAENAKRDDLAPMEVARLIDKHVRSGKTQHEIAVLMGETDAFVSLHLALLSAPTPIREAYSSGRIASVRSVYDLSRLHQRTPDAVNAFLTGHAEISRRMIQDLAKSLSGNVAEGDSDAVGTYDRDPPVDELRVGPARELYIGAPRQGLSNGSLLGPPTHAHAMSNAGSRRTGQSPASAPRSARMVPSSPASRAATAAKAQSNRIVQPLLKGEYQTRAVIMLLDRRPSAIGRVYIQDQHNGDEVEVDIAAVANRSLTDAQVRHEA